MTEQPSKCYAPWVRLTGSPFVLGPRALATPQFVFLPPTLTCLCSSLPLTSGDSGSPSPCSLHQNYWSPQAFPSQLLLLHPHSVEILLLQGGLGSAFQGPSSCVLSQPPGSVGSMSPLTASSSVRFVCSCVCVVGGGARSRCL